MSNFVVNPYSFSSTPTSSLLWENTNADDQAYNFQYSQAMRFDDPDTGEENADVIGKVITSIKIGLKKVGDPGSTTVSGRYWFSDGASPPEANDPNSPDINSDTTPLDKDDLTTSFVLYEFVFDGNTRTVVAGDAVGIQLQQITVMPFSWKNIILLLMTLILALVILHLGIGQAVEIEVLGFRFMGMSHEP